MARKKRGRFAFFVLGSIIGATAGILSAPKKGVELRKEIQKRYEELAKQGREAYEEQKEKISSMVDSGKIGANKKVEDIRERIEETKKRLQDQVDEAKRKVTVVSTKSEKPDKTKEVTKKTKNKSK